MSGIGGWGTSPGWGTTVTQPVGYGGGGSWGGVPGWDDTSTVIPPIGSNDVSGWGTPGWDAPPTSTAAPTGTGFGARMRGYYDQAGNWVSGAGAKAREMGGAAWDAGKQVPGAVWRNPFGKAAVIGAGLYAGGRYVAYPLLAGSGVIDSQTQEKIGQSPAGRFFTGESEYDPNRTERILNEGAKEYQDQSLAFAEAEQERMRQDYIDKARLDSQLAYEHASNMGQLGLGLGTNARFRDTYAGQLRDSTLNYLKNMEIANQGIANILSSRPTII